MNRLIVIIFFTLYSKGFTQSQCFTIGADMSYTNSILSKGGIYRDSNRNITDPYALFAQKGANMARIRLWHTPENNIDKCGNPISTNNLDDVVLAFKKAKTNGMKLNLSIHYGDYFNDPGNQKMPKAWMGLSQSVLLDSIYNYTYTVLKRLNKEGVTPDIVAIGNETTWGFINETTPTNGWIWPNDADKFNIAFTSVDNFNKANGTSIKKAVHFTDTTAAWLTGLFYTKSVRNFEPSDKFDEKFKQHQNTNVGVWDFVQEHLQHLLIHFELSNSTTAIIERSPKILFDRLIAFYVQKGLPVPIDASKFQQGLKEHFIERDGMFFTNEQVQIYDKKKTEFPEFIQLSLLVSSEQDGVIWLKSFLDNKRLAYQDIQPQWMQALSGVRKGDILPELAVILEENFLKDETGKWYVPDPENEADLEKMRNKRLFKLFEAYKDQSIRPQGRLKEVRVEALRAGFKQCYQDKDFKTIVKIGDKIPNNLLMEDEVLLQFYDIASSRI